ncbi:MAG: hypothetical protein K0S36_285 [Nitrosospira multiformis]|jgi:hypothetical protein|nr:hypothetical protein [Nitrosospira multiformis]
MKAGFSGWALQPPTLPAIPLLCQSLKALPHPKQLFHFGQFAIHLSSMIFLPPQPRKQASCTD